MNHERDILTGEGGGWPSDAAGLGSVSAGSAGRWGTGGPGHLVPEGVVPPQQTWPTEWGTAGVSEEPVADATAAEEGVPEEEWPSFEDALRAHGFEVRPPALPDEAASEARADADGEVAMADATTDADMALSEDVGTIDGEAADAAVRAEEAATRAEEAAARAERLAVENDDSDAPVLIDTNEDSTPSTDDDADAPVLSDTAPHPADPVPSWIPWTDATPSAAHGSVFGTTADDVAQTSSSWTVMSGPEAAAAVHDDAGIEATATTSFAEPASDDVPAVAAVEVTYAAVEWTAGEAGVIEMTTTEVTEAWDIPLESPVAAVPDPDAAWWISPEADDDASGLEAEAQAEPGALAETQAEADAEAGPAETEPIAAMAEDQAVTELEPQVAQIDEAPEAQPVAVGADDSAITMWLDAEPVTDEADSTAEPAAVEPAAAEPEAAPAADEWTPDVETEPMAADAAVEEPVLASQWFEPDAAAETPIDAAAAWAAPEESSTWTAAGPVDDQASTTASPPWAVAAAETELPHDEPTAEAETPSDWVAEIPASAESPASYEWVAEPEAATISDEWVAEPEAATLSDDLVAEPEPEAAATSDEWAPEPEPTAASDEWAPEPEPLAAESPEPTTEAVASQEWAPEPQAWSVEPEPWAPPQAEPTPGAIASTLIPGFAEKQALAPASLPDQRPPTPPSQLFAARLGTAPVVHPSTEPEPAATATPSASQPSDRTGRGPEFIGYDGSAAAIQGDVAAQAEPAQPAPEVWIDLPEDPWLAQRVADEVSPPHSREPYAYEGPVDPPNGQTDKAFTPPTGGISALGKRPGVTPPAGGAGVGPTPSTGLGGRTGPTTSAAVAASGGAAIAPLRVNEPTDLWHLVSDPAGQATAQVPQAPADAENPLVTWILTVLVALVIVALVFGFLYMATGLFR